MCLNVLKLAVLLVLSSTLFLVACEEDTIEPQLFGNVFGEVLDKDDNVAIDQATVSTNPPTSSVITDIGGRFVLENIPEGTYSLRAEKNGFLTQVASVTVFGDQDANVIVRLEKDSVISSNPSVPSLAEPLDGASSVSVNATLRWMAENDESDETLTYTVTLFNFDMTQRQTIASAITDTSIVLQDLAYGTNYFWQVTVSDGVNDPVLGPVWGFETLSFPDHRFLFARSTNGKYDIYSSDGLGQELKITDNVGSSWRPRMNPQRTKIAFISNANIQPQLYVMNRDGSDVEQVTSLPISGANQLELDFAWSPDGTQLLYMAGARLYKINLDGSGFNFFAQAPRDFTFAECDWSAQDGVIVARIVGSTAYRSFIVNIDDQGTIGQFIFIDINGATGGPKLSIPGTDILYTHDVSGFESQDERQLDATIFIRNIASGATIDLSANKVNGTNDFDPIYSPDGSKVMFTNTNNDGISIKNIMIMNVDGTNREILFENAEMPEWK